MAKGVIPDSSKICVAAARSLALKQSDVIILGGCRLNWMLHFGSKRRFGKNKKYIHLEILPEEIGDI